MSVGVDHVVARALWTATNSHPIRHAEIMVTGEAIIDRGNVGPPHQKHNAKMVELVAELRYRLAMITQEVEPRRRSTTQCDSLLSISTMAHTGSKVRDRLLHCSSRQPERENLPTRHSWRCPGCLDTAAMGTQRRLGRQLDESRC